jgi:hypothetical protein
MMNTMTDYAMLMYALGAIITALAMGGFLQATGITKEADGWAALGVVSLMWPLALVAGTIFGSLWLSGATGAWLFKKVIERRKTYKVMWRFCK